MPNSKQKSRTYRRINRVTPGGRTVTQYKKRKPSKAKCGNCRAILIGVPSERPYKMQNMAKTAKRPQRPFGGVLCSKCSRQEIIRRASE